MSGQTFAHFIAPQPPPLSLDDVRRIIEEQRAPFEITFGDKERPITINLLDYEISREWMPEGCVLLRHRQRRSTWIGAPPVRVFPSPQASLIVNTIEKTITIIDPPLVLADPLGRDVEREFGLGIRNRTSGAILRPQDWPQGA